jgi:acyl-CoA synthetase (NDP forming)
MARPLGDLLFRPASVALVGASADPGKVSGRPLRFLRERGFAGRIHPVNRRGGTIAGLAAAPTLDALPECPDHAFVTLDRDAAVAAVADCVRLGVPLVSVLSDGFGEAGQGGAAREARLRSILAGGATRLLGPNCMGVANPSTGLALTANASLGALPGRGGPGFLLASQSGSMIGALLSRAVPRGLGFSRLASVGAELDLDAPEVALAELGRPDVTGVVLFLETVRSAASLSRLAHAAEAAGKPVLVYQLGRSVQGRALGATHTGAMTPAAERVAACLRDLGLARIDAFEGLVEAMPLFAGAPLPARPAGAARRVGVVTTTGGGAALVVDRLGLAGIEIVPPAPATVAALGASGVAAHEGAAAVDLTLAGARGDTLRPALRRLARDPGFDLLLVVLGSSAAAAPDDVVPAVIEGLAGGVPAAVFVVPEAGQALAMLGRAGIAAFRTPEACADAIAARLRRRPPRITVGAVRAAAPGRTLTEARGLDRLDALGLGTPRRATARIDDAAAAAVSLPWPVVVKADMPGLAHKSEAGGVVLGVDGPEALARAAGAIASEVEAATGRRPERVLLAEQVATLAELIVGYAVDPVFGPTIMVAEGGVAAELSEARAVRLAPVDRAVALEMLAELPIDRRLRGFRSVPPCDRQALADAIARLSDPGADVLEAEINPLGARARGAVALDALVVLREDGA